MNMRLVIILLGSSLLLSIAAITYLAAQSVTIPDVLQNVAVASLTGLAGVLAGRSEPTGPPLNVRPAAPAQHRAEAGK